MEYYSRAIESCDPSQIFTDEITDILRKTLQDLPAPQRQIFVMSRVEGKTYNEIAHDIQASGQKPAKNHENIASIPRGIPSARPHSADSFPILTAAWQCCI